MGGARSFTWVQLVAEPDAIAVDFQAIYHLDLAANLHRSWVWFSRLVSGLLQMPQSVLYQTLMRG